MSLPELKMKGDEMKFCPYYYQYAFLPYVDMLFMPYNYLVQPGIRNIFSQILEGSIIIIDEAHNIPNSASEALSYNLTFADLAGAEN